MSIQNILSYFFEQQNKEDDFFIQSITELFKRNGTLNLTELRRST